MIRSIDVIQSIDSYDWSTIIIDPSTPIVHLSSTTTIDPSTPIISLTPSIIDSLPTTISSTPLH